MRLPWKSKTINGEAMNRATVIEKIDRAFAPDLKVRVTDDGMITGFAPVTQAGAEFLLHRAGDLLNADYDHVLRIATGLTFEVYAQ